MQAETLSIPKENPVCWVQPLPYVREPFYYRSIQGIPPQAWFEPEEDGKVLSIDSTTLARWGKGKTTPLKKLSQRLVELLDYPDLGKNME